MHSSTAKPKIVIEKEQPNRHIYSEEIGPNSNFNSTITPSRVQTKVTGDKHEFTKFTTSAEMAVHSSELFREDVETTTALTSDEPENLLKTPQFALKKSQKSRHKNL